MRIIPERNQSAIWHTVFISFPANVPFVSRTLVQQVGRYSYDPRNTATVYLRIF